MVKLRTLAGGVLVALPVAAAIVSAGITPAHASGVPLAHTEAHACHELVEYSRGHATRKQVTGAASQADPDLNRAIMGYVLHPSWDSWWNAMSNCGWGL